MVEKRSCLIAELDKCLIISNVNHELVLKIHRKNKHSYTVLNSEQKVHENLPHKTTLKEFFAFLVSLEIVALFSVIVLHFSEGAEEDEVEPTTFVPVPIYQDGESYVFNVPNANRTPDFPEPRLMVNLSDQANIELMRQAVVHSGTVLNPGAAGIEIAVPVPQK